MDDKNNKENNRKRIRITRESFCLADDCDPLHEKYLLVNPESKLSELCEQIASYIPVFGCECVWVVCSPRKLLAPRKVLAYIVYDEKGNNYVELATKDVRVFDLSFNEFYCRYFPRIFFMHSISQDGKFTPADESTYYIEYPECPTLIEKVKKHLGKKSGIW